MKKKSLNAKKIIHRKLINYLKISSINKVYLKFSEFLKTFKKTEKLAVAVSGGPDSLALVYLAKCYSILNNVKINFYHVDHRLRPESNLEAKKIKLLLKKLDINCKILVWKGTKPNSNIQSIARKKRYSLIHDLSKKDKVKFILVAHHLDDLYENFFIRLLRGSGLKGLISFNQYQFNYSDSIKVLRPLINTKKQDLINISQKVFNFYLEDPSNNNTTFKRVRMRNLINNLQLEGLDENKFKLTLKNLTHTNVAINYYVKENIDLNSKYLIKKKAYILRYKFFDQPQETVFRSLSIILREVGKRYYPSRGKSIEDLIVKIRSKKFNKVTLSNCIIEKVSNSIIIYKEIVKKS